MYAMKKEVYVRTQVYLTQQMRQLLDRTAARLSQDGPRRSRSDLIREGAQRILDEFWRKG
jgi:Arc/MetJ-type ribon-helix-helix transcriptional regulator